MTTARVIKQRNINNDTLANFDHLHPVLARIFVGRGVTDQKELATGLNQLLPYQSLLGIDAAVACIVHALHTQQRILIVGDFDADGATSTTIAMLALAQFGAEYIDFLVPNRFEYGYGLTPEIVEVALQHNPDLIITVDNGITSIEGVALAKSKGLSVIITDHHLACEELPAADAIVNPNQPNDQFQSKQLAGCGVIFYVMLAVRAELRKQNWFATRNIKEPNLAELLDIVALGTVADLVPLDRNNRILVSQGLARIKAGKCRPGIQALIQIANRQLSYTQTSDLAFAVAPRLNAAGRLTDMSIGIACLLAETMPEAMRFANQLDSLNKERREIEATMSQQAFVAVQNLHILSEQTLLAITLYDPNWHQGIIGIVAGRIKERMHRPVIAFAKVSDDELKGSARSIPGLHIRDALDVVAKRYPQLIHKFGGHAMAAGLSLPLKNLDQFKIAFSTVIEELLLPDDLKSVVYSDGILANNELTLTMAEQVKYASPWGQAFPEPIFDGIFDIVEQRLLQGKHLKLRLALPNTQRSVDAIYFNIDAKQWPNHKISRAKIAYRLDINRYGGHINLQLMVEYIEVITEE